MALLNVHPREDLLRYLEGDVAQDEKLSLESHLASCVECRTYLSTVKGFNDGLGELAQEEFTSQEACPDSWTLVSYEDGKIDEGTARQLRAHLLFCDACQEEFYALRKLRTPNWTKLVLNLVRGAVELVSISGSGVPGLADAASELRGGPKPSARAFTVEEVAVDPEMKSTSTVRVRIEPAAEPSSASILIDVEPPQPAWRAYLHDGEEQELESMPLSGKESPIGSKLSAGTYALCIRKGADILSSFEIEIRST